MREGYVDLNYDDNGNLVIERNKGAWDPEEVARRAVRLATEGDGGDGRGREPGARRADDLYPR